MPDLKQLDPDTLPAGRELDALVAEKVFGCNVKWPMGEGGRGYCDCKPKRTRYYKTWPHGITTEEGCNYPELHEYSESIAAAWEVVEKLLSIYPGFRVEAHVAYQSISEERRVFWTAGEDDDRSDWHASGPTAPLAICRAALKAKDSP
jgi:hypothetical protein